MVVTQCASSRLVMRLGSSTTTVSPSRYAVTVLRRRGLRTTLTSGFAEAAAGRSGRGVDLGIVATSIPCSPVRIRANRPFRRRLAPPAPFAPKPPAAPPSAAAGLGHCPGPAGRPVPPLLDGGFGTLDSGRCRSVPRSARTFFFVHKLAASDRLVTAVIEFSGSTSCPQPRAGCPQAPAR